MTVGINVNGIQQELLTDTDLDELLYRYMAIYISNKFNVSIDEFENVLKKLVNAEYPEKML